MKNLSAAAHYTLRFINQTQRSVFLTGKAGTGKTTLLHEIIRSTHKNVVVVAPTGIAALNAGGVTIHSMFQLPFAGFIPAERPPQAADTAHFESRSTLRRHFKMNATKKAVIRRLELLVIDEVSMLRADLLDAIDFMMQTVRQDKRPFGGVQLLFIGDLMQLPPVVKNEEWRVLRQYYPGKFFFHAHVIRQNPPLYIELSKIYRQSDDRFIGILNNLRNNKMTGQDLALLNTFVQPDFDRKKHPGTVILTTHNAKADSINIQSLQDIAATAITFEPEIIGDFPEKIFPVDAKLHLKKGAQIMFVKNDLSFDKQYYNGKMGEIRSVAENEILVHFPQENKTIEVERYEWQNIRYKVNEQTKEIEEELLGTFTHFPIKLAWAITVHKSQGLTFDRAALDVSQVFAPGQAYVALSRLRSLNGLVLLSPMQMNGIASEADVIEYADSKADENALDGVLQSETADFLRQYLKKCFDWPELSRLWWQHQQSYVAEPSRSPKAAFAAWAAAQSEQMVGLQQAAVKFGYQIEQLFALRPLDLPQVAERINAAHDYFLPQLDTMTGSLYYTLEAVKRTKKAKILFDELLELEELQTHALLQIMKAKRLAEAAASGVEFNKENLESAQIRNYRQDKIASVQQKYREENPVLVEEAYATASRKGKKEKAAPKKNTVLLTYELWQEKNSIREIAKLRKLTPQTIGNHMAKLITIKAISIADVLPQDKLQELAAAFEGYNEESLSALKEQQGTRFTWDELKLFKASLEVETS